ncbi:MAG: hypothetical protein J0H52_18465, partial [Comamonadaceae bacterium]|nr:hypothetical protein [Comamonadaceae bacterium]
MKTYSMAFDEILYITPVNAAYHIDLFRSTCAEKPPKSALVLCEGGWGRKGEGVEPSGRAWRNPPGLKPGR